MQWKWSPTKKVVRRNKDGYEIELEVPRILFEGKWYQH